MGEPTTILWRIENPPARSVYSSVEICSMIGNFKRIHQGEELPVKYIEGYMQRFSQAATSVTLVLTYSMWMKEFRGAWLALRRPPQDGAPSLLRKA